MLAAIVAYAPNARVAVLDYPQLYDLAESSSCMGLNSTDRIDLNRPPAQESALAATLTQYSNLHGP